MFRQTKLMVQTSVQIEALLDHLANAAPGAGPWDPADVVIRLFDNDVDVTPETQLADLTEASFVGYAAVTVTAWEGPGNVATNVVGLLKNANYIAGVLTTQPTIYGYYLTNAANDTLLGAERFESPVAIANENDLLNLTAIVSLGEVGPQL